MTTLARMPEADRPLREPPRLSAAERFLRDALEVKDSPSRIRVVTFAAPVANASSILALAGKGTGLFFDAPDESTYAALGAAAEIRVAGEGRFAALRQATASLFAGLAEVREPGVAAPAPRLFGGLAFAPGVDHGEAWAGFGDGLFVLPRWVYSTSGERASLSFAVGAGYDPKEVDRAIHELGQLWDRLLERAAPSRSRPRTTRVEHLPFEAWSTAVDAIREAIREGSVAKVVAARRATVELDGAPAPEAILERLKARFPLCTCFALLRDGAAFVGATPERLVERRGAVVTTEALAGSIARGRAADLLSSLKDREEHRLVVDAIVEGLTPFCTRVTVGSEPRIRDLPNLLHMQTPIEGRARDGVDVLELVKALHPTPAVGGVPTVEAMRWIVEREAAPRGWYGAPFGWVDASGDGAFVVALRSGVVRGDRVFVYAGAGIMEGSSPIAEYEETALKMQALLGALDEDQGA
ncbi:MAG: isochorismate synthase [Polyangiaceae bacterium]|nr:isochorismate synthase [Polyangiaceae bacterium]